MVTTDRQADDSLSAMSYRALFAIREYRALFVADVASQLGDQLAAVAVAVPVFDRSHSPFLAALAYCLAFLPWVVGGPVLAAVADRLPSRRVLVGTDLVRAGLIGVAALPGLPLAALGLAVLAAAMLGPPFRASRSGLISQLLDGEAYSLSMSVQEVLAQSAQIVGFVVGGALVAVLTAQGALALDAASFLLSGLLLWRSLHPRDAVSQPAAESSVMRDTIDGLKLVAFDARLRRPLLLAIVGAGYVIVPEAVAPAYSEQLGGDALTVGSMMAAVALGSVIGAIAIARFVRRPARERVMVPLAWIGTLPLLAIALHPGLVVSLLLFVAAGICTAYNVPANAAFAAAVPSDARSRAFGVAMTGMMAAQVLGIALGGALAGLASADNAIALAGAVGFVSVLLLQLDGRRAVATLSVATPALDA